MEAALAADPMEAGAADALDDGASEVTPRFTGLRQRTVLSSSDGSACPGTAPARMVAAWACRTCYGAAGSGRVCLMQAVLSGGPRTLYATPPEAWRSCSSDMHIKAMYGTVRCPSSLPGQCVAAKGSPRCLRRRPQPSAASAHTRSTRARAPAAGAPRAPPRPPPPAAPAPRRPPWAAGSRGATAPSRRAPRQPGSPQTRRSMYLAACKRTGRGRRGRSRPGGPCRLCVGLGRLAGRRLLAGALAGRPPTAGMHRGEAAQRRQRMRGGRPGGSPDPCMLLPCCALHRRLRCVRHTSDTCRRAEALGARGGAGARGAHPAGRCGRGGRAGGAPGRAGAAAARAGRGRAAGRAARAAGPRGRRAAAAGARRPRRPRAVLCIMHFARACMPQANSCLGAKQHMYSRDLAGCMR
jgi:hypothetical protein